MEELKLNKRNMQHIIYEKEFIITDNPVIDSGGVSQEGINTFANNLHKNYISYIPII